MSHFKAKMHQIRFRLGLRPDPAEGAYSAPRPLAGFKGPTSKGREKEREKGGRKGRGKGRGKEREGIKREGRGGRRKLEGKEKGEGGKGRVPLSEILNTPLPVCDFLLVINSNLPPILRCFQVMADYWSNFRNRGVPHFNAPAGGSPANIRINFTSPETRRIVLPDARSYLHLS